MLKDFISKAPSLIIDPPHPIKKRDEMRKFNKSSSNTRRMKELKNIVNGPETDTENRVTIRELKKRMEGMENHLFSMNKKLEESLAEQKIMIESFIASMTGINKINQSGNVSNHGAINAPFSFSPPLPNSNNSATMNNSHPIQSKVDFHVNSIMSTANDAEKLIKVLAESPELGGAEQPLPSDDFTERYKLLKKRLLAANMKLLQLELDKMTTNSSIPTPPSLNSNSNSNSTFLNNHPSQ